MSGPVNPDYILTPGGGEICECCGRQGAVYMVSEGAWLCLDAVSCTHLGMSQLMDPLPDDPADGPVLPGHDYPNAELRDLRVRITGDAEPDPAAFDWDAYL